MRIEDKEVGTVQHVLQQAANYGARYVLIEPVEKGAATQIENLAFFSTKEKANAFEQHRVELGERPAVVLPVQALRDEIERKVELEILVRSANAPAKDMVVDTKQLLFEERARVEIFQQALSHVLKDQGIRPDQQQLRDHLLKDDPVFLLNGTRREGGVEKPLLIRIEQDEHRAFIVGPIGHGLSQEQQNKTYLRSEVLEGSVQKEVAGAVMQKLQDEKEKGNFFVSYPAGKEGLVPTDFIGAKSAFGALEHAVEKMKVDEIYAVKSIRVVETELGKLMEEKKEVKVSLDKNDGKEKGNELSK